MHDTALDYVQRRLYARRCKARFLHERSCEACCSVGLQRSGAGNRKFGGSLENSLADLYLLLEKECNGSESRDASVV